MRRPLLASVALLAVFGSASVPAAATVTHSNVTAPAAGTQLNYDDRSGPTTFAVAGTTNGLSPDTVTLVCDRTAFSPAPTIGVLFDTTFSASVELKTLLVYGPCLLRAVPTGFDFVAGDLSAFPATPVSVLRFRKTERFATGPNAGLVDDYSNWRAGSAGGAAYYSIADCGVCDAKLIYPASNTTSTSVWSGNAEVFPSESSGPTGRSYLKVDGRNAVGPGYALAWGDGTQMRTLPGMDPIDYTYADGPGGEGVVIHESDHFDRCTSATEPNWPPLTLAACPSLQRSGIRVDRTITQSAAGTEITIVDAWISEDGLPHDLDLHYDEIEDGAPHVPSFSFPWQSPVYATHLGGDTIAPPSSAPASWFVSTDSLASDGSTVYPQGSLTFDPLPDAFVFRNARSPQLRYHRTVPAGGSFVVTHVFNIATTRAAVQTAAAAAEVRLTPPVVPPVAVAPPGVDPAPLNPPTITPKVRLTRALRVSGSRVLATLQCTNAPGASCRGQIKQTRTARVKRRLRTLSAGSAGYSITAGATRTITLKLSASAAALLRSRHRLSTTVRITYVGASGRSVAVATRHAKFKVAAKRKPARHG